MRAHVVTEPEMIEMLDRIQTVVDRIGVHYPYSQELLKKVTVTMGAIIANDKREFEV